jgi:AcrR family transcriptional regulator
MPDTLSPPHDMPTRILDAVERIVMARGVAGLTLEAAAREAGVSKGGLLHHYASKEALLTAMLGRLAEFIIEEHAKNVAAASPGPGRVARAFISWAFGEGGCSPGDERHDRASAVFLAAFHHDPALLDPLRAVFARMKDSLVQDGIPPGRALTVLAACDGLFMAHVFRTHSYSETDVAALRETLEALLEPSA